MSESLGSSMAKGSYLRIGGLGLAIWMLAMPASGMTIGAPALSAARPQVSDNEEWLIARIKGRGDRAEPGHVYSVARLRTRGAFEALESLAESVRRPDLLRVVYWSLVYFVDVEELEDDVVAYLAGQALHEYRLVGRETAAEALVRFGPKSRSSLWRVVEGSNDDSVRAIVIAPLVDEIASIGGQEGLALLLDSAQPHLSPGLSVALRTFVDEESRKTLLDRLTSRDTSSIWKVLLLELLVDSTDVRYVRELRDLVRSRDEAVALTATRCLQQRAAREGRAAEYERRAKASRAPGLQVESISALADLAESDDERRELLTRASRSQDRAQRIGAALAVDRLSVDEAGQVVVRLLEDKDWRVRRAAIDSASRIPRLDVVEKLIDGTAGEPRQALRWECAVALAALTGKSPRSSVAEWRQWASEEGDGLLAESPIRRFGEGHVRDERSTFGRGVPSDSFVLFIDYSPSMYEPAVVARTAVQGGSEGAELETRWDRAIRDASSLIAGLRPEQRFNVGLFSGDLRMWRDETVEMTDAMRADALDFIRLTRFGSGTDVSIAIQSALDHEDIDTVVLLTDGEPNQGALRTRANIESVFRAWVLPTQIRFHCISVAGGSPVLRALAEFSRGTYREIAWMPDQMLATKADVEFFSDTPSHAATEADYRGLFKQIRTAIADDADEEILLGHVRALARSVAWSDPLRQEHRRALALAGELRSHGHTAGAFVLLAGALHDAREDTPGNGQPRLAIARALMDVYESARAPIESRLGLVFVREAFRTTVALDWPDGADGKNQARAVVTLASAELRSGRPGSTIELARRYRFDATAGAQTEGRSSALSELAEIEARAHRSMGSNSLALVAAERAFEFVHGTTVSSPARLARLKEMMARLRWDIGHQEDAWSDWGKALAFFERAYGVESPEVIEARGRWDTKVNGASRSPGSIRLSMSPEGLEALIAEVRAMQEFDPALWERVQRSWLRTGAESTEADAWESRVALLDAWRERTMLGHFFDGVRDEDRARAELEWRTGLGGAYWRRSLCSQPGSPERSGQAARARGWLQPDVCEGLLNRMPLGSFERYQRLHTLCGLLYDCHGWESSLRLYEREFQALEAAGLTGSFYQSTGTMLARELDAIGEVADAAQVQRSVVGALEAEWATDGDTVRGQAYWLARAYHDLAPLERDLGDPERALELMLMADFLSRDKGDHDFGRNQIRARLAGALFECGRFRDAAAMQAEVQATLASEARHFFNQQFLASVLLDHAWSRLALGELSYARSLLQQARGQLEAAREEVRSIEARLEREWSGANAFLDPYRASHSESLALSLDELEGWLGLASEDFSAANEHFSSVVQASRLRSPSHAMRARCGRGFSALGAGDFTTATRVLTTVVDEEGHDRSTGAWVRRSARAGLAQAMAMAGDSSGGRELVEDMVSELLDAELVSALGAAEEPSAHQPRAFELLNWARAWLEFHSESLAPLGSDQRLVFDALESLRAVWGARASVYSLSSQPRLAGLFGRLALVERALDTRLLGERSQDSKQGVQDLIAERGGLLQEIKRLLPDAGFREFETYATDVVNERMAHNEVYVGLHRAPGAKALGGVLGVDEATARYFAYMFGPSLNPTIVDLGPASEMEERIEAWRSAIVSSHAGSVGDRGLGEAFRPSSPRVDGELEAGLELYRSAVEPILDACGGNWSRRRFSFALDGAFGSVPLQALPSSIRRPGGTPRIGEVVPIKIVASSSCVGSSERRSLSADSAALIGDINYGDDPGTQSAESRSTVWPLLPGTRLELDRIDETLRENGCDDAVQLSGDDVTRGNVAVAVAGKNLVHLATHGWANSSTAEGSSEVNGLTRLIFPGSRRFSNAQVDAAGVGLVLSGANESRSAHGHIERVMTARDLERLDLRSCEVLVLSGCSTAQGAVHDGLGIQSLQAAGLRAGAACVVGSLWSVPDDWTARLMAEFYARLTRDSSTSIDVALRGAQSALREAGAPLYAWAGWSVLHGR